MTEANLVDTINLENEFNYIVNESLKVNKALNYLIKAENIVTANEELALSEAELYIVNKYLTLACEEINIKPHTIKYPMVVVAQEGIGEAIRNVFDKIFEFIGKVFEKIGELIGKIADWFKDLFKSKSESNKSKCDSINSTIKEIKDFPKLKDPIAIPNDTAKKLLDKLDKIAILLDRKIKVENMFYLENNIVYVYITKSLDTAENFVNKTLLELTDIIKKLKDELKLDITPVKVLQELTTEKDNFVESNLAISRLSINNLKDPFQLLRNNDKFKKAIEDSVFNKEVLVEIPNDSFASVLTLELQDKKAIIKSYRLEDTKVKQIKNTEKDVSVNVKADSVMIDKNTNIKEVNKTSFDNIYNKFAETIKDLSNECKKIGKEINKIDTSKINAEYKEVFTDIKNVLVNYASSIKSVTDIILIYGNFVNELYSVLLDINNDAVVEIKKLKEKEEQEKKQKAEEAIEQFVSKYYRRSSDD